MTLSTTILSTSSSSLYQFNVDPVISSFSKISKAVDEHDYKNAVEFASFTMNQINQSLLFSVLDYRIHALCKIYNYEAAICDAKHMVSIAPSLPLSYLRLGNLYTIQGKQKEAIKTYETALKNCFPTLPLKNDSHGTNSIYHRQQEQYQNLIQRKNTAIEQYEKRVDFISMLPKELSFSILAQLNKESKSECLETCKKWCEILLACPMAWYTMNINNNNFMLEAQIESMIPDIAPHVRYLSMDTSLRITEDWNLLITDGFRHIQNSLTELKLDLVSSNMMISPKMIKISDLLIILPHLIRLVYKVPDLELDLMGDFSSMSSFNDRSQGYPLKDLDLQLHPIHRRMIEPLLQHCSQLRRLALQICMDDFVDLLDLYCPNLRIIAYNYGIEEVVELDKNEIGDKNDGLRKFYFSGYSISNQPRFDYRPIMSLILNNASTMDTINIGDWSTITQPSDQSILPYDTTHLKKMTHLKNLSIDYDGTHPVAESLLQYIPDYHALTTLDVCIQKNLPRFIDHLIAARRPQQTLRLMLPTNKTNDDHTALLELFQHYTVMSTQSASLSKNKNIAYTKTLETLRLWDATNFLTDQMLNTISNIKSITNIEMVSRSSGISPEGLNVFIRKLSEKMTDLRLGGLDIVDDDHLIQLADQLKSLTHLKLEVLENITDYGLIILMDRAIHLKSILISTCPLITETVLNYAKLKHIEISINDV
ncbi:hypothetical protein INT45_000028 [Circinella minor]|uniref:F-box domain-containing protein n=1 Tax=Circinella minor TaxID=1195481 RepID=A0A8H7VF22_9FUNG|nr:hypothetical protein INT45_000028 [Circinella minor]